MAIPLTPLKKNKSLRSDFMFGLFLTMVITLCVAMLVDYKIVYSKNMEELKKEARVKIFKAVETLKQPLWHYDVKFIRSYVEILSSDHSVIQISIFDERNKMIAHMEKADAFQDKRNTNWQLEQTIQLNNKTGGRVVMQFTNSEIRALTTQMLLLDILMVFTSLFSVLGVTWLLMAKQILSPLKIMEESFHKIATGDYSKRVTLEKENELSEIANEFNTMVEQVELRERKIKESEIKYRNLVESSSDIIFKTDLKGMLVIINQNFEKWTDFESNDFIDKPFIKLFSSQDSMLSVETFTNDLKEDKFAFYELEMQKKDGSIIPVELNVSIPVDINGQPEGITGIARDITERKNLESKLHQSQKMEAIGTLAGGIAHDFNNIIGGIIGYAEMIEMFDVKKNEKIESRIQHVLKGAYRAKELTAQILTFSRHSDEKKKPVKLSELIKDTMKFLRASIPSTIEIIEELDCPNCIVWADETSILQVLMNLCTNASHAMQKTGGTLSVSLLETLIDVKTALKYSIEQPGTFVKLSVNDTGEGIKPLIMERIFDPFFTTKQTGDGTGMGLSVVHGIIKSLGGTIMVHSTPGSGTSFDIYIPIFDSAIEPEKSMEANLQISPGKGRVLFIDDEEDLVSFSKEILEHIGYEVVAKTSSMDAREAFLSDPMQFDLVITDQTMPNITGFDLAVEFLEKRKDIPIVLCTGFSLPDFEKKAMASGITQYVKKPIGARQLVNLVDRLIRIA